jgi:hypothetical protein
VPRKPPQPKAATKPEFDASPLDEEDDAPAGGGIPDDDGMVYLRRSVKKPTKGAKRGKGKTKPA